MMQFVLKNAEEGTNASFGFKYSKFAKKLIYYNNRFNAQIKSYNCLNMYREYFNFFETMKCNYSNLFFWSTKIDRTQKK